MTFSNINDDFSYIGEVDCDDVSQSSEEILQIQIIRVNAKGKHVRGKYINWKDLETFPTVDLYKESDIFNEISEEFTQKRYHDWDYGEVYNFVCKCSQRVGFLPFEKEIQRCWSWLQVVERSSRNHHYWYKE